MASNSNEYYPFSIRCGNMIPPRNVLTLAICLVVYGLSVIRSIMFGCHVRKSAEICCEMTESLPRIQLLPGVVVGAV
jgi:hypothetical protein